MADIDRFFIAAKVTPAELKKIPDPNWMYGRQGIFAHKYVLRDAARWWRLFHLFLCWRHHPMVSGVNGGSLVLKLGT